MKRLMPWPLAALIGWTLFTWINRVPLLWSDEQQTTAEKVAGTGPVVVFVSLAGVAAVTRWRDGDTEEPGSTARKVGTVLAGWSIAYWAVRLPFIMANDHPGAFKVVHAVLGLLAGGLGAATLRALRSTPVEATPAAR